MAYVSPDAERMSTRACGSSRALACRSPRRARGRRRPPSRADRRRRVRTEERRGLVVAHRLLARGAGEVGLEHVRVRRVDHRGLGRLREQIVRVVDQVLVERIVLGDQDGDRRFAAPARAPGLLPHRGARARVAGEERRVQRTHVDPQLQGVRRRDAQQLAGRRGRVRAPCAPPAGSRPGTPSRGASTAGPALGARTPRPARPTCASGRTRSSGCRVRPGRAGATTSP